MLHNEIMAKKEDASVAMISIIEKTNFYNTVVTYSLT